MINPKWLVIGVALISATLLFNYDARTGIAAGAVLLTLGLANLWIALRLAPGRGEPRSERDALFGRFSRQSRNRQLARVKEQGEPPRTRL